LRKIVILIIFIIILSFKNAFCSEVIEKLITDLSSSNDTIVQYSIWKLVDIGSDTVEPLIKSLSSDNKDIRLRSAIVLGLIKDERSYKPLLALFQDKDKEVQASAIKAVSSFKDYSTAPVIMKYLDDSDELVRMNAILALYNIGNPALLDTLKPRLIEFLEKDDDSDVRYYSVKILGSLKDKKTLSSILSALKDESGRVRLGAVESLPGLADKTCIKPLIDVLDDSRSMVSHQAILILTSLGENAVNDLIDVLKDDSSSELKRAGAALVLGKINTPMAREALLNSLSIDVDIIRHSVFWALSYSNDLHIESLLMEAVLHEDNSVRLSAEEALSNIPHALPVNYLLKALRNEKMDIKRFAALQLGRTGADEAVIPLVEALHDKDYFVQRYAAESLIDLDKPQSISLITPNLKDDNEIVRAISTYILSNITLNKESLYPLIDALNDRDVVVRLYAADALGKLKDSRAIESLLKSLKDGEPVVRLYTVRALGNFPDDKRLIYPLIDALSDNTWQIRREAAISLGNISSPEGVNSLINSLQDMNEYVRGEAAIALGKIGNKMALMPLMRSLKDEYSSVRKNSARALGNLGDKEALVALRNALYEEESIITIRAIKEAIKKLERVRGEK